MISGEHVYIRTSEEDDVPFLQHIYAADRPAAALLDRRREPLQPTREELREFLRRDDHATGAMYTIEDKQGRLRGLCSLRAGSQDLAAAQLALVLVDEADYATELALEAYAFVQREAFVRKRLNKIVSNCMDYETALRAFLVARGFESDGVQRDVFYGAGTYHSMESLTLFRRKAMGDEA